MEAGSIPNKEDQEPPVAAAAQKKSYAQAASNNIVMVKNIYEVEKYADSDFRTQQLIKFSNQKTY